MQKHSAEIAYERPMTTESHNLIVSGPADDPDAIVGQLFDMIPNDATPTQIGWWAGTEGERPAGGVHLIDYDEWIDLKYDGSEATAA